MIDKGKQFIQKYPLVLSLGVFIGWLIWAWQGQYFHYVIEYFEIIPTMLAGSFIAGATAEGGGAVSFPVMTLVLKTSPVQARDFGVMIQSVGMLMASLTIILTGQKLLKKVLLMVSLGGIIGVFLCLQFAQGIFPPLYIKMFFTSLWLSFAIRLFILNRNTPADKEDIPAFDTKDYIVFLFGGIIGGMITGLVSCGIDIVTFALLRSRYRLKENIATPNTIILMWFNSVVTVATLFVSGYDFPPLSVHYFQTAIPVVIFGAPLGVYFIRNKSPRFVAYIFISTTVIQFITSLAILPQDRWSIGFSLLVFTLGLILFSGKLPGFRERKTPDQS